MNKVSLKWSSSIGKRQPLPSWQWFMSVDNTEPSDARVWSWPWWPPQRHWRPEASQGKAADTSKTFSSNTLAPLGRGSFCALAAPLRQVIWLEKFKAGHIDKYNVSNNPEEFIQVYHTVIEAAGGDDWVKANYLPTTLIGAARSWLINLPEGSIYNWDQLCTMFIRNF
jgi:hypothetical protein